MLIVAFLIENTIHTHGLSDFGSEKLSHKTDERLSNFEV